MKHLKVLLLPCLLFNLFSLKATCQSCTGCSGVNQSPVNITNAETLTGSLNIKISDSKEALETAYAYVTNSPKAVNIEAEITNHHHNDYILMLNGNVYKFANVHYHMKSEHKIQDKLYGMEAHFVFKSDDVTKGAVVIGMLIDKASDKHKAFAILDSLVQGIQNTTQLPDSGSYHFSTLIPDSFKLKTFLKGGYYSYPGSLTTYSYSEGVTWIVLKKVEYIDAKYYTMFENIQKSYNYGARRDTQPINNRVIIEAPAGK